MHLPGIAFYARVSSADQKDDLVRQLERLQTYAIAKGDTVSRTVMEVASGLNISERAGRWFVSVLVEEEAPAPTGDMTEVATGGMTEELIEVATETASNKATIDVLGRRCAEGRAQQGGARHHRQTSVGSRRPEI